MTTVAGQMALPRVRDQLAADAERFARIMLVAVPVGMVSVGVVARLVMRLLAAVNPPAAGLLSDDGFVIDQFTLSGSVNLLVVGVFFGALSGVLYAALAPLKTGPVWFQRVSLSVGAGVVVSSQLVHTDGVDFVVLDPYLLPIALFVGVPVLHVLALDLLVDRAAAAGRPRSRGASLAGLALGLLMAPLTLVLGLARVLQLLARGRRTFGRLLDHPAWARLVRAALTGVFSVAVVGLVRDTAALG